MKKTTPGSEERREAELRGDGYAAPGAHIFAPHVAFGSRVFIPHSDLQYMTEVGAPRGGCGAKFRCAL